MLTYACICKNKYVFLYIRFVNVRLKCMCLATKRYIFVKLYFSDFYVILLEFIKSIICEFENNL